MPPYKGHALKQTVDRLGWDGIRFVILEPDQPMGSLDLGSLALFKKLVRNRRVKEMR